MTGEIVRDAWPGASREVGRRADHGDLSGPVTLTATISAAARSWVPTPASSLRHNVNRRLAKLELEVNLRVGR